MAQKNVSLQDDVTQFLDDLNHPFRKEIEALRSSILGAEGRLTENIKWNGPNYSIDNEDRITMKIHPPKKIQLIFHRGAKVKDQPANQLVQDDGGLLEWRGNDRAIMTFKNMDDIERDRSALVRIVKDWVEATT